MSPGTVKPHCRMWWCTGPIVGRYGERCAAGHRQIEPHVLTVTTLERCARMVYERLQLSLLTPWDDLDTERAPGHRHIGSGAREPFYDLVRDLHKVFVRRGEVVE